MLLAGALMAGVWGCAADDAETTDERVGSEVDAAAGGSRLPAPADLVDATAAQPCDASVAGEEEGTIETVYAVVDGALAGVCFGEPSTVLVSAWLELVSVTPDDDRMLLAYFAGFDGGRDTLAFTTPVDDDYEQFVVAIDLVASAEDPAELRLTMVHEFAHAITQSPDQLDVAADPDACTTYYNGAGCFRPGSYLDGWIDAFWTEQDLREQPADGSADEAAGAERCSIDPRFLGAYAASSPEEDFAESFSAFVFGLDVPEDVQPKIDWFAQVPDLATYRELGRASGLPQPANTFDRCG